MKVLYMIDVKRDSLLVEGLILADYTEVVQVVDNPEYGNVTVFLIQPEHAEPESEEETPS